MLMDGKQESKLRKVEDSMRFCEECAGEGK